MSFYGCTTHFLGHGSLPYIIRYVMVCVMPKMEPFKIKIYVEGVGLCIDITSSNAYNLLVISANVVKAIRIEGMEPTIELQP